MARSLNQSGSAHAGKNNDPLSGIAPHGQQLADGRYSTLDARGLELLLHHYYFLLSGGLVDKIVDC